MSIANYSDLSAAVANWTSRSDLAAGGANANRVDEIIALAEALINRELRTTDQETKNATFSITAEYVALPTDFLEARSFYLNTSPIQTLSFMPVDTQTDTYQGDTGQPKYFSVVGSNFRFGPPPDGTYSATLIYYAKLTGLSGSNTTNWLITSHPDIYLSACRYYAYNFIQNYQAMAQEMQVFSALMDSMQKSADKKRWGGNSMAVRVG